MGQATGPGPATLDHLVFSVHLWWWPGSDLGLMGGPEGTLGAAGAHHPLSWAQEGALDKKSGSRGGDGRREGAIPLVGSDPASQAG